MTVDGARNVHRGGPRHALVRALCMVDVTVVAGKNEVYDASASVLDRTRIPNCGVLSTLGFAINGDRVTPGKPVVTGPAHSQVDVSPIPTLHVPGFDEG